MEIELQKEKLQTAITQTERVTGKNLSLDILGFILITTQGNNILLRATNLDIGIEITIPAKIKKEGSIAVPGAIISNLLSNIHTDKITLKSGKNNNLTITTKNTSTNIKTRPYNDFPLLPKVNNKKNITLPISVFLTGISSVWYSSATSNIKPEISSIYIYTNGDSIYFAATDSFRLAEKRVQLKTTPHEEISLLIPYKNVIELIRIFEGKEGDVVIYFDSNQISFNLQNIYITSRLVDGIFPDYKQIIPKEFTTEIVVLKEDFLNALKITNLFSDKFNKITFQINKKENLFNITAHNVDLGENKTTLQASINGDDVVISFNHKYIVDCLNSIKQDSVVLKLNNKTQPMVIKGVNNNDFTYLIMPLNQ